VITARVLGPVGRGAVATATTWSMLFCTVGYLSLGQVAIHRAAGRAPEEWLGPTLAALLVMTGLVSVGGWATAGLLYGITDGDAYGEVPGYALVLGFVTLPFLVWEFYGSSLLTAVGRISVYNRAEVAGRTVGVVLVVVLVALAGFGIAGALVALIVAQAIVAATGVRYLITRAGSRLAFSASVLRGMVADGAKLHLNAVGSFLVLGGAVLIVQHVRGPAETGQFQLAVQLTMVALLVPQAAAMVLYGEVARLGPDRAWRFGRRVLILLVPVMTAGAGVAALAAPAFIPFVFGDDFSDSVPVFQLLAFSLVGQTFAAVMAPQWVGRGLFWQAAAITLATGILNVAASFPLVDAYGKEGAAYALLGTSFLSVIGNGTMAVWVNRRVAAGA
jgi:enterobacterial common antigen flippase